MIGYFLFRSKFVGTNIMAVEIRLAVGGLDLDRNRRLPAGGDELRDVGLLERHHELAVARRAARPRGGDVGLGVRVDEILAVGRQLHRVVAVVGRQRDLRAAVDANAIEVREVRILALLASVRRVPDRARLLIDARDLRHRTFAARDLSLQLAGVEIVEVELAPVVALRVPDHFVRRPQHAPAGARLEVRRHRFLEHRAHRAGRRVGDAQRRRTCDRAPSTRARASSRRGSSCSRSSRCCRRSSRDGTRAGAGGGRRCPASTSMITRCSIATTESPGSGYFHALSVGCPTLRLDEEHVADFALVLLRRRDLLRVRRPEQNRAIAARPAGVVRRVAEVLLAVGRELLLLTGRDVAHPEIPVANERGALAVGRHHGIARGAAASTAAAATASTATTAAPTRGVGFGRRRNTGAVRSRRRRTRRACASPDRRGRTRRCRLRCDTTCGRRGARSPRRCRRRRDWPSDGREHFRRVIVVGGGRTR